MIAEPKFKTREEVWVVVDDEEQYLIAAKKGIITKINSENIHTVSLSQTSEVNSYICFHTKEEAHEWFKYYMNKFKVGDSVYLSGRSNRYPNAFATKVKINKIAGNNIYVEDEEENKFIARRSEIFDCFEKAANHGVYFIDKEMEVIPRETPKENLLHEWRM